MAIGVAEFPCRHRSCHHRLMMAVVLLVIVVVLVIAALVFGVVTLLSGDDPGLAAVEPDGRAVALPNDRSLTEADLKAVRFDLGLRGYRMAQVDRVLRRTAYDVGYKDEMIAVLEAEVAALREGRAEDAELLRKARESAANPDGNGVVAHRSPEPPAELDNTGQEPERLDRDPERLDHDPEPVRTEDPGQEPTGEPEPDEEKASAGEPEAAARD